MMGDLEDILPGLDISYQSYEFFKEKRNLMSCTTIVKLNDQGELLVGHNTHNIYSLMLRMYKVYWLKREGKELKIEMSSRPGDLSSKDDFYVVTWYANGESENRFVVTETSLSTYDNRLYTLITSQGMQAWQRAAVANRLASTPTQWALLFPQQNAGTHNNQWILVDTYNYQQYSSNLSQIVIVLEQYFDLVEIMDLTEKTLLIDKYLAGYNLPISKQVWEKGEFSKYYNYTYQNDPRGVQIGRHIKGVKTGGDLLWLLRMNGVDEFQPSLGYCSGIAPRCDLPFPQQVPWPFGAIDAKVTSNLLQLTNLTLIISSPTHYKLIPF